MKNGFHFLIFLSALCLTAACKKEGAFSAGSGINNDSTCLVSFDSSDQFSTHGNGFLLTYDGNDHLLSGTVDSLGIVVGSFDVTSQQIVRRIGLLTETFQFTKSIFGGNPDSYTYTNSGDATLNRTVHLTYNSKGQVSTVSGSTVAALAFTYDEDDDLTSIVIGGGGSTTTYTSTGYDNKNSPFYGQSGAALLFYNWDYTTVSYTDLFRRLSRHNITGWNLTYPTGSTNASYDYTYDNTNNLPTAVTQSTQSSDNGTTYPITYAHWFFGYDCK